MISTLLALPVIVLLFPWFWFKKRVLGWDIAKDSPKGDVIFELEACMALVVLILILL